MLLLKTQSSLKATSVLAVVGAIVHVRHWLHVPPSVFVVVLGNISLRQCTPRATDPVVGIPLDQSRPQVTTTTAYSICGCAPLSNAQDSSTMKGSRWSWHPARPASQSEVDMAKADLCSLPCCSFICARGRKKEESEMRREK